MKKFFKNNKINIFLTIIIFTCTLIFNQDFFTNQKPFTTYLYPYEHQNLYWLKYIILRITNILLIFLFTKLITFIIKKLKEKNTYYKLYIEAFLIIFIILIIYMLKSFPVVWSYDTLHILEYSTTLKTIPWHNVYTSLFYIISLSFIPHPISPVFFQIILFSTIFSYIYAKLFTKYPTKFRFLFLLILTPINLYYINWVFRTSLSSFLELFAIFFTLFNLKKQVEKKKLYLFYILIAFLASYRTENIYYIILPLLLNYNSLKNLIKPTIFIILTMFIINLPQKIISNKYYTYDYLIISTYESLQYILNSIPQDNKTLLKEQSSIEKIIPYDYLRNYGSHSYFEYNYENTGYATVLNKSKEEQISYLISVSKIFLKNYKLVIKNKINLFTSTLLNKTYYPTYPLQSLRPTYYFEKEANELIEYSTNKYNITNNQKSITYNNSLLFPFSLLCLLILIYLIRLKKEFFLLSPIFLKLVTVIIFAPGSSYMYFYYIYLIG